MAGWMVIVGSVIVVLTAFQQLGTLHTVEVRESVQKFLSEAPGNGLGLSVDSALMVLRVLSMVAAGCATAAAVLGWHVLRRDRASRVALTVVAVPLFFAGIASGGFFSSLVAASALMLWSRPARDWFDGVTRTQPEVVHPSGARDPGAVEPPPPPAAPLAEPPPYAGFGLPAPDRRGFVDGVRARPDQVLWSCILVWAFSSVSLLILAASAAELLTNGGAILDEARAQNPNLDTAGMTDRMLLVGIGVVIAAMVVWALLTIVVAFFVWRGHEWARIVLICSAGATAGLTVVAFVAAGSFVPLPLLIASGVTMRLLLTRPAAAWCRRPSHQGPNAPG